MENLTLPEQPCMPRNDNSTRYTAALVLLIACLGFVIALCIRYGYFLQIPVYLCGIGTNTFGQDGVDQATGQTCGRDDIASA